MRFGWQLDALARDINDSYDFDYVLHHYALPCNMLDGTGRTRTCIGPVGTAGMNMHLRAIGAAVVPGARTVVVQDGCGWCKAKRLEVPENVALPLPRYSPELNPTEMVFERTNVSQWANPVSGIGSSLSVRQGGAWAAWVDPLGVTDTQHHPEVCLVLQIAPNTGPLAALGLRRDHGPWNRHGEAGHQFAGSKTSVESSSGPPPRLPLPTAK